ncbi:MAG: DUF3037 domain-containing protein [Bacteroidia bacterium]|nr:DUF3037 domain-containing protein [Bacteroidia bacterium]
MLSFEYSAVLGEIFNIGLLLVFPDREVHFLYPKRLHRLREVYPDFGEQFIKENLKGFKRGVDKWNKAQAQQPIVVKDLDEYALKVRNHLLVPDDSSLQFGPFIKGVLYTPDREKIVNHLYHQYFFPYQRKHTAKPRHDEEYLTKTLKTRLQNQPEQIYEQYFQNLLPKEISKQPHLSQGRTLLEKWDHPPD